MLEGGGWVHRSSKENLGVISASAQKGELHRVTRCQKRSWTGFSYTSYTDLSCNCRGYGELVGPPTLLQDAQPVLSLACSR